MVLDEALKFEDSRITDNRWLRGRPGRSVEGRNWKRPIVFLLSSYFVSNFPHSLGFHRIFLLFNSPALETSFDLCSSPKKT
jgi:hypothetical protein